MCSVKKESLVLVDPRRACKYLVGVGGWETRGGFREPGGLGRLWARVGGSGFLRGEEKHAGRGRPDLCGAPDCQGGDLWAGCQTTCEPALAPCFSVAARSSESCGSKLGFSSPQENVAPLFWRISRP